MVIAGAKQNLVLLMQLGWETTQDQLFLAEAEMLSATVVFATGDGNAARAQLTDLKKRLSQLADKPGSAGTKQLANLNARCEKLLEAMN